MIQRFLIMVALAVAAVGAAAEFARQSKSPLDAVVHFDGKPISMVELAQIVAPNGIKVKYGDHLADRQISIATRTHTLRVVFDSVCDLEGWTWRLSDNNELMIEEPAPKVRSGETVYSALRRTTPPDLANYLRMPPVEKLTPGTSGFGKLDDRHAALSRQLQIALSKRADALETISPKLSTLTPREQDLITLAIILSPAFQRAAAELISNSDWQLAIPQATRLSLQQGSILMIECELGMGQQVGAFGANIADSP